MKPDALLLKAAPHLNALTMGLALKNLTEEQASALKAKMEGRRAGFNLLAIAFAGVWLCATVVWLTSIGSQSQLEFSFDAVSQMFALFLVAAFIGMVVFFPFGMWQDHNEATAKRLAPISGTSRCSLALAFLKDGFPEVQAWRDHALSQRDMLRDYDVSVMEALHVQATAAARAQLEAADQEAACREVHGVASAA